MGLPTAGVPWLPVCDCPFSLNKVVDLGWTYHMYPVGRIRIEPHFQHIPNLHLDIAALVRIRNHLSSCKAPLWINGNGHKRQQLTYHRTKINPATRSYRLHCEFPFRAVPKRARPFPIAHPRRYIEL